METNDSQFIDEENILKAAKQVNRVLMERLGVTTETEARVILDRVERSWRNSTQEARLLEGRHLPGDESED